MCVCIYIYNPYLSVKCWVRYSKLTSCSKFCACFLVVLFRPCFLMVFMRMMWSTVESLTNHQESCAFSYVKKYLFSDEIHSDWYSCWLLGGNLCFLCFPFWMLISSFASFLHVFPRADRSIESPVLFFPPLQWW